MDKEQINFEDLKTVNELAYMFRVIVFFGLFVFCIVAAFLFTKIANDSGIWAAIGYMLCDLFTATYAFIGLTASYAKYKQMEKYIERLENEKCVACVQPE